ncbi:hypothetical protein IEE94_00205 [Yimella sp. cx-573]|nr:hypothetical protein [Yimella sp. cx-573]
MRDVSDRETRLQLGALTVGSGLVACVLLAVGAAAGAVPLAIALMACGLVIAWGWPVLLDLPRPFGSSVALLVGVVGIGAVEMLASRAEGLQWLASALAISLMAVFMRELLRKDGRRSLTISISGAVFGLAVLALGAFHLMPSVAFGTPGPTYAAAGGVAIGLLLDWTLGRTKAADASLPLSLLLAAGAGAALGVARDEAWSIPMLAAVLCCGAAHALRRVVGALPRAAQGAGALAVGVGSVLFVGVVPYATQWLLSR